MPRVALSQKSSLHIITFYHKTEPNSGYAMLTIERGQASHQNAVFTEG